MKNDYYNTKASVEEYIKMAKDVNGEELIQHLQKFLPGGSSLLEIGSGPGNDWSILNQHYAVSGSDNSAEFLKYLSKKYPHVEFLNLDANTLKTRKKFDGIYSNKVFQHLKDIELTASIKRQTEVLNDKGVICHSFWKGEGTEIFNGLFVNYQSENTLKRFFENDFDILLVKEYQEFDEGDSILLIARKK